MSSKQEIIAFPRALHCGQGNAERAPAFNSFQKCSKSVLFHSKIGQTITKSKLPAKKNSTCIKFPWKTCGVVLKISSRPEPLELCTCVVGFPWRFVALTSSPDMGTSLHEIYSETFWCLSRKLETLHVPWCMNTMTGSVFIFFSALSGRMQVMSGARGRNCAPPREKQHMGIVSRPSIGTWCINTMTGKVFTFFSALSGRVQGMSSAAGRNCNPLHEEQHHAHHAETHNRHIMH